MIYQRTKKGEDIFRSKSDIPRTLRLLLAIINRRTDHLVYVETLTNFGDVEGSLSLMEEMGLIEIVGVSASASSLDANETRWQTLANETMKSDRASPSDDKFKVTQAITAMSDFCTLYLPDKTFEMQLNFEMFETINQLTNYLTDYQAQILPLGEVGTNHIKNLQSILKN